MWNDDQPKLYAAVVAGQPVAPVVGLDTSANPALMTRWEEIRHLLLAYFLQKRFADRDEVVRNSI